MNKWLLKFVIVACWLFFSGPVAATDQPTDPPKTDFSKRISQFDKPINKATVEVDYNRVSQLWREVAVELKEKIEGRPEGDNLSAVDFHRWQEQVSTQFDLLKRVSQKRELYLAELRSQGKSLFKTDNKTIERMGLEVSLIPYKLLAQVYEKKFWFDKNAQRGLAGYSHLLLEVLLLLTILLVPFVVFRASRRVEEKIEEQKRKSFYLSFKSQWHRRLTNALAIVPEYLPWFFSYLALKLVNQLLNWSEFSEVANLLPYFFYYIYYKVFRVTLELLLREFAAHVSIDSKQDINEKIKNTSRFLGLVLLIIYSLKTAFMTTLGESLIFSMIEPFFGFLILALLFYVSSRWEKEVEDYLRRSNIVLLQKFSKLMATRYSLFLSLPGLVLIVLHFTSSKIIDWSSQFDIVKLLYARVLRVKYESTRSDDEEFKGAPDKYIEDFLNNKSKALMKGALDTDTFKKIEEQISGWEKDENYEQTVAVYGPQGSGKTSFLELCKEEFSKKEIDMLSLSVPAKVFTEKSFDALVSEILEIPEDRKTIVLLDNAHNLFISTIGGFQIYQKFLERTEELKHIFWIATFNDFSWDFLNSVLGKNQYFRLELKMPKWDSESLKTMILKSAHPSDDWSLRYDQIFRSSQRLHEGVTSAENRYFYLIWEKSHGYPGLAISYWFKSLQELSESRLKVCLPRENPVAELGKLHLESHFVYAAILKHQNLNVSEATRTTNMPRAVVKQAMYRGIEEGFLEEEEGRYSVNLGWIDDLKKYLKGKNLLYEV